MDMGTVVIKTSRRKWETTDWETTDEDGCPCHTAEPLTDCVVSHSCAGCNALLKPDYLHFRIPRLSSAFREMTRFYSPSCYRNSLKSFSFCTKSKWHGRGYSYGPFLCRWRLPCNSLYLHGAVLGHTVQTPVTPAVGVPETLQEPIAAHRRSR